MKSKYKNHMDKLIEEVAEAIAKLATSKYTVQFKESPKTSRVNTPTPSANLVLKYDSDVGTNESKHIMQLDEMSEIGGRQAADETTEDEEEQPRDLRYRSINNIMSALQRAQVTDAASRAAIAAMIRGPGSIVSPGMPFHAIPAVTSTTTATPTPNVSPHLPLVHAHQPMLNFPPPSPPRSFASSLMPTIRAEVATSGSSSVIDVGAANVVPSTNASNINSSISITPTTSISVAGSSGGGPAWGGAYTCDRCGNSYARPHSLNRHVRFECGVEPKFECPICHKKSKHKHNLVLHMRTHQHR